MEVSVSGLIESIRYNGGHSTRKPSTVTMTVGHKFAIEVGELIEDYQKKGIEPEEGLLRLELIAHYADREVADIIDQTYEDDHADDSVDGEQIIEDLTDNLDETLNGEEGDAKQEGE